MSSSLAGSLLTFQTLFLNDLAKSSCMGAFMPAGVWLHRGAEDSCDVDDLKDSGVDSVAYVRSAGVSVRRL
jgi:hypothetical protein